MSLSCEYEETDRILAEANEYMQMYSQPRRIQEIIGAAIFRMYDAAGGRNVIHILCSGGSRKFEKGCNAAN